MGMLFFKFISKYFLTSSLNHCFLKSVLFNFYTSVHFTMLLLFLICSFIPLWLENNTLHDFNLLKFIKAVLKHNRQFVMKGVSCALEKNVSPAGIRRRLQFAHVGCNWSPVLSTSSISLLIFCLALPFLIEGVVLRPPSFTSEQFLSPFSSVRVLFKYFGAMLFDTFMFTIIIFSCSIGYQ